MGDGEEHGVVKIADFGLARIYQAPLKPLSENGVREYLFPQFCGLGMLPNPHPLALFIIAVCRLFYFKSWSHFLYYLLKFFKQHGLWTVSKISYFQNENMTNMEKYEVCHFWMRPSFNPKFMCLLELLYW